MRSLGKPKMMTLLPSACTRLPLKLLVQDTEAALALALADSDDAEMQRIGWLLSKILGDDLDVDDQGEPQIAQGTAPDRIISVTDPEMRHGRKSQAHRFNGHKVMVVTEESSELVVDIADVPAPGSDGQHLLPAIRRIEAHSDLEVERALADGTFGSGDNRATCAAELDHPVDLLSPVARPPDAEVAKSAFQIDLEAETATCPQGETVSAKPAKDERGRPILTLVFPRATCEACPLFTRCVRSKTAGRTVRTHAHEAYLQTARARQETAEFKAWYVRRGAIERKIGEGARHGPRNTRYLGHRKRQLQRLWTGAMLNVKRLLKLAEMRAVDLRRVLEQLNGPPVRRQPT